MTAMEQDAGWRRRVLPFAALAALATAAHAPVLANGFVWDDEQIVVGNPDTRDPSSLGRVLLSPDETPPYYRPLTRASYLLDHALFGMDARGFHAVSLAIHVAGVLLLYAVARALLGAAGPAWLAAALLAVHPIHSESVAFVSARNNLFALAFALASFLLLVDAERRGSHARAVASGLAFFLGLLSKEPAAMALPFLLAWVLVPRAARRGRRTSLALLLPHAVALAAYLSLRHVSLAGAQAPAPDLLEGLAARLSVNWWTLPRYLALVVFPRDLTVFHAVETADPLSPGWLPAAWLGFAAIAAWCAWRRTPAALAGLLWLVLYLAPISNVVPIPSALVAERHFHLAAVGLWVVAADAAAWARERLSGRRALALGSALTAALALRTAARARDWRDDVALFESAARTDPRSVPAHYNLGVARKDAGDLEGARREWEEALRLDPGHAGALAQLGTLAAVRGDLRVAEGYLRRGLATGRASAVAHYNLARILERTRREREALDHYEAVLRLATPFEAEFVPLARERAAALGGGARDASR